MTEAGRQRMRLVQAAFDDADRRLIEEGGVEEQNELRRRLRDELIGWEAIGIGLNVFDGRPVASPGAPQDGVFETAEDFQLALVAAIEDLRPERLEFVRLLVVADPEERAQRLVELAELAAAVRGVGLRDVSPTVRVAWALSGRESSIEDPAGPSAWRSNPVIQQSDAYRALNEVSGGLAFAALTAELGDSEDPGAIVAAVAEAAPGFGLAGA